MTSTNGDLETFFDPVIVLGAMGAATLVSVVGRERYLELIGERAGERWLDELRRLECPLPELVSYPRRGLR